IDSSKYKNISSGFGILLREQGIRGFFRVGHLHYWDTVLRELANSKYYSDLAGPENAAKYKTLIYLAGSASAEVIADIGLCPFEAVKVRVQTQLGFAKGLSDGFPKLVKAEGYTGLYKGLFLFGGVRFLFATFENIVEQIYKHAIPKPKNQCSNSVQLGVSFAGGYIAGVFCAIHDNLVSFLNNAKGASVSDAVKKLGMWGLFTRGLPLRIVMIGTLTGAQWGIYDAFKVFVGLPTTGGAAPPPAKYYHGKQKQITLIKTVEALYAFVPLVVDSIKTAVQEIIDMGASLVVVPGNFPIGRMPLYLSYQQSNATAVYDDLHCLHHFNEFAVFHNNFLLQAINHLRHLNPSVTVILWRQLPSLQTTPSKHCFSRSVGQSVSHFLH
ncbi:hypothetical protein V2J09_015145, partial [Rumex salicifolius]